MEYTFKKGFDNLKKEIINNNSEIRHLIKLDDKLVFVIGIFKTIDSFDYLFCKRIHPAIKNLLKDMPGIFFQENYIFENERERGQSKYEYIIKIEDAEKHHIYEPHPVRNQFHLLVLGLYILINQAFEASLYLKKGFDSLLFY